MTVDVNAAAGMSLSARVADTKQCAQCKSHRCVICANAFRASLLRSGPEETGVQGIRRRGAAGITGSIRRSKGSRCRLWLTQPWS